MGGTKRSRDYTEATAGRAGAVPPAPSMGRASALVPRSLRLAASAAAAASAAQAATAATAAAAATPAAAALHSRHATRADVGPVGVLAAALSEAVLAAALDGLPAVEEEAAMSGEADEVVGAAAAAAWNATTELRAAVDAACVALAGASDASSAVAAASNASGASEASEGDGVVEALAGTLAAAAAAAALAELGMKHAPASATVAPDPDGLRTSLSIAVAKLSGGAVHYGQQASSCGGGCGGSGGGGGGGGGGGSWSTAHPRAAAKAAALVEAALGLLAAAGPSLSASAHATLLAAVVSAYNASVRGAPTPCSWPGGLVRPGRYRLPPHYPPV